MDGEEYERYVEMILQDAVDNIVDNPRHEGPDA